MVKKRLPDFVIYLLSLLFIVGVWQIIAVKVNASLIIPTPFECCITLKEIIVKKTFWINFHATFGRVIISFVISIVLGAIIGFLCGISRFAKTFFELPISIIRATPVIAFILVAYFWFTSTVVPVFVTVLMTLPIMITSVCSGFEKADKDLLNMAKVFNFSNKEVIRYIKIPNAVPYFINGAISCFGLSWKVVAAGEVICLPKKAIGTMLQKSGLGYNYILIMFAREKDYSLSQSLSQIDE